jgi:hypothetical protein
MKTLIVALVMLPLFMACKNQSRTESANEDNAQTQKQQVAKPRVVVKEVHYVNSSSQPAKRGWSSGAKGAVIGGAGGAILGGVISKNHVKGAIIGGAVGAGTGYIIGHHKDKKRGRY